MTERQRDRAYGLSLDQMTQAELVSYQNRQQELRSEAHQREERFETQSQKKDRGNVGSPWAHGNEDDDDERHESQKGDTPRGQAGKAHQQRRRFRHGGLPHATGRSGAFAK